MTFLPCAVAKRAAPSHALSSMHQRSGRSPPPSVLFGCVLASSHKPIRLRQVDGHKVNIALAQVRYEREVSRQPVQPSDQKRRPAHPANPQGLHQLRSLVVSTRFGLGKLFDDLSRMALHVPQNCRTLTVDARTRAAWTRPRDAIVRHILALGHQTALGGAFYVQLSAEIVATKRVYAHPIERRDRPACAGERLLVRPGRSGEMNGRGPAKGSQLPLGLPLLHRW